MKKKCEEIDLTEYIRKRAEELWEEEGFKQGYDLDYWLQAEEIIRNEMKEDLSIISNILRNNHRK